MTKQNTAAYTLDILAWLRAPLPLATRILILVNVLIFALMLFNGAGLWHSQNAVQMSWGANFAPATANGEWWRLFTAMFLHFGAVHLGMNMYALRDGGKLVEQMFGRWRMLLIYLMSGLGGNLLSLVIQGNHAISGGASGAIFGLYGSLMVYLWIFRAQIDREDFRWMFGGAAIFSLLTIGMGFVIAGIDNAAHIGGVVTGALWGYILLPADAHSAGKPPVSTSGRAFFSVFWMSMIVVLLTHLPVPKYNWQQEVAIQAQLKALAQIDQQAQRNWGQIVEAGKQGNTSFSELATRIDEEVAKSYEQSFEALSKLSDDPKLPSANALEQAKNYTIQRRNASKAVAEKLRNIPFMPAGKSQSD